MEKSQKQLHWKKGKKVSFNPEIIDNSETYNISFAFRHVYGFQLKSIKIRVQQTTPSGNTQSKDYEIPIFTEDDTYLSTCAGDICDLETLIEKDFKFEETGTYTYEIEHLVPIEELPNVMEIGMIIDKNGSETGS